MDGVQQIMDSAWYCIVSDFVDIIFFWRLPSSTCVVGTNKMINSLYIIAKMFNKTKEIHIYGNEYIQLRSKYGPNIDDILY